jgi:DNA-binding NarL/FixJ family response regulator
MPTVLIVETNEQLRKGLASMVEDLATAVHEYGDGATALSAFIEHRPDWVLMGLGTAERDGIDATRKIMTEYPLARIVVVGDYDTDDLRDEALSAGAVGYVLTENMIDVRAVLTSAGSKDRGVTNNVSSPSADRRSPGEEQ